jgi:hypothetical protein
MVRERVMVSLFVPSESNRGPAAGHGESIGDIAVLHEEAWKSASMSAVGGAGKWLASRRGVDGGRLHFERRFVVGNGASGFL